MKQSKFSSWTGAHIRQRLAMLIFGLLACSQPGFMPALRAVERYWSGSGAGENWSNPFSWVPIGIPQDGDDLVFGGLVNQDTPGTMVNDLPELTVRSMKFEYESEGFFDEAWVLNGNELVVTGDITCTVAKDIEFNCALTLGRSITVRRTKPFPISDTHTLRFNGPVNLAAHDLTIVSEGASVYRFQSTITGQGRFRLLNRDATETPLAVFGGSQGNLFAGYLLFERSLEPSGRPFHASFDQPGGNVVNGGLHIGDACEVRLQRADQIGDDAAVSITGGGRLLLSSHSETIGSLALTNVPADADSTLVDASGTTLTLRRGITTSVSNPNGRLPIIKGQLALPSGSHIFNLNNALSGPGLQLQGPIVGQGGFSKFGNATLVLAISNSFSGPVSVHDGILELQNQDALGTSASGLTLTDGTLVLRDTFIQNETLSVRGTKPVTVNTAGSFLSSIGFSGWVGRIELDTNLVVHSSDLCILGGPIVGPGGFEFVGSRIQITGGTGDDPSTFEGLTRSLCDLLVVSLRSAFRGNLIVGGGFRPQCEVRWQNSLNRGTPGFPELILHTNGLANLNGASDSFAKVTFHGGSVVTGSGFLGVGTIETQPTNVTATIDGNLSSSSSGGIAFIVDDGPASPDLSVNAVISDGLGTSIEKAGAGTMTLHRANSYSGATRVRAGTLALLHNSALGATAQGTIVSSGGTVAFGTQIDTMLESFTVDGSGAGGTAGALQSIGDVWINTNLVLLGSAAIRTEGTNSRIQVNNISGSGSLTKLGSGRLVLRGNANNTYSGDTLVAEGVLDLAKPNGIVSVPGHLIIGTSSPGTITPSSRVEQRSHFTIAGSVTVNGGGLWDLNGASEDWLGADLQGRPPLTLNDGGDVQTGPGIFVLPAGGGIVVNPGAQRFGGSTVAGRIGLDPGSHRITVARGGSSLLAGPECNLTAAISENNGTAELEKDGGGTLRLAGTNTYRGVTRVAAGTIQIDGVQPQSATRVLDGGRLQGIGTVGSIETLGATATVAPGTTPSALVPGSGILTCSDFNVGAAPNGVFRVKLNGPSPDAGYDQINARGAVRLTGLTLQGSLGFASSIDQQFIIINNDGVDPVQDTFVGLPQNTNLYIGSERFTISYTGGTGNDVVLTRQVTPQLNITTLPATEIPNRALDFDGRFTRVHVGTNLFPGVANNFTVEVWANPTASRLETAENNSGISDIGGQRHAVFPDQGDFGYGAGHAGAGLSIGTNGISAFEHANNHLPSLLVYSNAVAGWTHLALVCSNRQLRLYVNGTLARAGLPSTKAFIHPSANLGGSIQGLTYGNYQGQLDEVRVWSGALSQSQIQSHLNRSLTGAEPGLLLYYRCEETNNAPLADSAPASPNVPGSLLNGVGSVLSGAQPPSALNGPSVTLNGMATPGGLDSSVWFEWGATTNYGNVTPAQSVNAISRTAGFSQPLNGLAAGQYQFRAVGSNGLSTVFGQNQSFTLLNGAPRLQIEPLSANQVRLLWPTNAVGFSLQANLDLNTPNWSTSTSPLAVDGTNHVVVDAAAGSQRFYRLFHP